MAEAKPRYVYSILKPPEPYLHTQGVKELVNLSTTFNSKSRGKQVDEYGPLNKSNLQVWTTNSDPLLWYRRFHQN